MAACFLTRVMERQVPSSRSTCVTVSKSAGPRSTRTRLFVVGEVTKLVPEIVTAVPAGAMVGRSP
jgi:hypothetical protein